MFFWLNKKCVSLELKALLSLVDSMVKEVVGGLKKPKAKVL